MERQDRMCGLLPFSFSLFPSSGFVFRENELVLLIFGHSLLILGSMFQSLALLFRYLGLLWLVGGFVLTPPLAPSSFSVLLILSGHQASPEVFISLPSHFCTELSTICTLYFIS